MKEFKHFRTLFSIRDDNMKVTKKLEQLINGEALLWFKSFGATFGTTDKMVKKVGLVWYYSKGMLFFGVPGQLQGSVWFAHIIIDYHFAHWRTPAFVDGFNAYKKDMVQGRKLYPFSETDFYNYMAWNAGFSLKLYDYTIESFLALFPEIEK